MIIKQDYVIYNHLTGLFYLELNKTWVSFSLCSRYNNIGEAFIQIDAILKANPTFCLSVQDFYTIR